MPILPPDKSYKQDLEDANNLLQQTDDPQAQLRAQMIIDAVNQEVTMQSNFEKSKSDLAKSIINNIGH
jgi:hypothetical protein